MGMQGPGLPAGLAAAAGSQKARSSDSAPAAAVLAIAKGETQTWSPKRPRHQDRQKDRLLPCLNDATTECLVSLIQVPQCHLFHPFHRLSARI